MAGSLFDIPAGWIRQIMGRSRADAGGQSVVDSRAGSEEAWQLTLKLVPGKTGETSDEPTGDLTVESPAWKENAEAVRTTVKWLVAAFAVIGALMFAKGFITTPKLSWKEDFPQLLSALGLGMLGLVSVGFFLYTAVAMLRPAVYDLNDLDSKVPKFIELVDNPEYRYLPEGITNFEKFRKEFEVAQHTLSFTTKSRDAARTLLKNAENIHPPIPEDIKNAEETLEWWQETLADARRNFNTMKTVRARLLNKAEYWNASTAFDNKGIGLVSAALVAAFGGIGYQLALAAPDEPAKTSASSTAAPTVGELIRSDSASGTELWEQLGLSRCQAVEDATRIAVVVSSGDGSAQNPYVVSTIPTGTCPGQTFTVIDPVARVSLPVKREIIYTPDSTTSPSTAGTSQ